MCVRGDEQLRLLVDQGVAVRQRDGAFRVLVMGRANAGKTTLLKKICFNIENPEIFSPSGEKIDITVLEGSPDPGHLIENELIFKSIPQFIFHDSRGFTTGSDEEREVVEAFIAKRIASSIFSEKLHAIWYCLPTDTLMAAEERFFNVSSSKGVPVIAVFTKFEGLMARAFIQLKTEGRSRREAANERIERAKEMLNSDILKPLMSKKYSPSGHVLLDDMRVATSNFDELIQKTNDILTTQFGMYVIT
ncbi:hypothetical protein B0H14DRAFT_2964241 [Mycena olivaceomarginata]|nr:hypothetical protein B0H14DRAFT_2964241 [Mycena olivaceomarginata]